jgi:hypothetical protein
MAQLLMASGHPAVAGNSGVFGKVPYRFAEGGFGQGGDDPISGRFTRRSSLAFHKTGWTAGPDMVGFTF